MSKLTATLFAVWVAGAVLVAGGCSPSGQSRAEPAREVPTSQPAATAPAATREPAATGQVAAPTTIPGQESRGQQAPPEQRSAADPAPTPAAAPAANSGAYQAVEQAVTRVRGLQPTREVELRFMSRAELRQYFLDAFNRDYPPDERARDQKLLVTLGLLRPDQDLSAIMLKVLGEEVIGFYDDDARRLYLIGDVAEPTPASKVTFAHEFTHALQDEHFNLKALNPPNSDNDDRSAAIQALVEGDATLTMTLYARSDLSVDERRQYVQSQSAEDDSGVLDEAPLVLRVELLFPYTEGLRFVQTLQRQGGFGAVDTAFRNPPQSTEQILHPEKYAAREAPVAVALPDLPTALGEGWRQTTVNTLGELDLRIMVEQFTDRPTAERAAAGWAGDRYALLEDASGRPTVVVKSAWDSSQDAWEFFQAYSQAVRNRYGPQARVVAREPTRQALAGDDYAALVALQGQEVVVVLAPDLGVMNELGRALEGS